MKMTVRQFLVAALAGAGAIFAHGVAYGQASSCAVEFVLSDRVGARASADIRDGGLDRLFVEMGPARVAMTTKGAGVSGAYEAQSPDLMFWNYMSIYQHAREWLSPGSVRLDYSGFRIGWPAFKSGGNPVTALRLTITQGERSMTADVGVGADGSPLNNRVFAIDFETMLPGPYPAQRVDDHAAWRAVAETALPMSVTLVDPANGKVVARAEGPRLDAEILQPLLSGGLNALREKFKAGGCS
ncbi:MAG: hypothetical protein B7Y90_04250 [Alphaproteobacteria bacterium 32-64-14]|nr:MAG: hypothetical protein B7Y90_04250 [Alphaproteobacteria bacterium 32-64-14]